MEAPRENTATAITANASTDMDQLVMDIVTKLVITLNLVNTLSYLTLQMNLGTFWIFYNTALTMTSTIAKHTVKKTSWNWFLNPCFFTALIFCCFALTVILF